MNRKLYLPSLIAGLSLLIALCVYFTRSEPMPELASAPAAAKKEPRAAEAPNPYAVQALRTLDRIQQAPPLPPEQVKERLMATDDPEVQSLFTALEGEKASYEVHSAAYEKAHQRLIAIAERLQDPQHADVVKANQELDREFEKLEISTRRITEMTGKLITAYEDHLYAELGVARRDPGEGHP
jgi:hypothetical protein